MPLTPDEHTPFCEICGEQIGLLTDCVVMLRGQFMWFHEDRYAPLVLEEPSNFEVIQFENAVNPSRPQRAVIVNPAEMGELTAVHRECLLDELGHDEDDEDEDNEDDDLDNLDRQMMEALERDEFPEDFDHPDEGNDYFSRR